MNKQTDNKTLLHGRQTWTFPEPPVIVNCAAIGGKKEGSGPLAECFDVIHQDNWLGGKSFETAEQKMLGEACAAAIRKADLKWDDINFHFSGDLLNQITASSFTAKTLGIPYLGLFGACSTSMEGLALAAYTVATGGAKFSLASTVSHTNSEEKQFRYPNEYGAQKNPTAQLTVNAAGAGVIGKKGGLGIKITAATIGKVIDLNISDPFNMGAAMAPAAADTIQTHLAETGRKLEYYDLILTGDLGRVGLKIVRELLHQRGIELNDNNHRDGGDLIYPQETKFLAGGSGCGCMAAVCYGHIIKELLAGRIKRVLCVATGALLSPLTTQQKASIPGIAHAVALEAPSHNKGE